MEGMIVMRCSIAITTARGRLARRFASECDGHHKNALFSTELKGSVNPLTRRPLQRFSLRRGMRGRKRDRSAFQSWAFVLCSQEFQPARLRGIDRLRTGCIIAEHVE